MVGVTGLDLRRDLFYKKELTFQVSCSYGPGRYDPNYELKGNDYPVGYVRWTEQRNFQAVLFALAQGQLRVDSLVTHRFPIDCAAAAYQLSGSEPSLGILLNYPVDSDCQPQTISLGNNEVENVPSLSSLTPSLSVIGVGNYASRILIPAFQKLVPNFIPLFHLLV